MVLFSVIAVNALLAMIKFILIMYGALVLLGFAVSEWTRDWTMAYLRAIVATGFTYYAMILTMDISLEVFKIALDEFKVASAIKDTWVYLATLFVVAIIVYLTTTQIPPLFGAITTNIAYNEVEFLLPDSTISSYGDAIETAEDLYGLCPNIIDHWTFESTLGPVAHTLLYSTVWDLYWP